MILFRMSEVQKGKEIRASSSAACWVILIALLMLLAALKFSHSVREGPFGLDASNYFQIARHVAEGQGLQTSVSLYHIGLDPLPQRSPQIYPVWPLMLGWTGRWIGMFRAADLLPKFLYLLDLFLLYLLSNRFAKNVWERVRLTENLQVPFDVGHLFVLILGLNLMFFSSTTHPYTEGAAFTLAFAGFLAIGEVRGRPIAASIASAILLSLAFLTRTQMIVAVLGTTAGLAYFSLFYRRFWIPTAMFAGTSGAIIFTWYEMLYKGWGSMAGTDPYQQWVEHPTTVAFLQDRLLGLAVGFSPVSEFSYVHLWSLAAYLPPIAMIVFLGRLRDQGFAALRPHERSVLMVIMIAAGLAFFGSLNFYHAEFFMPWFFGWRHGIPYLFLLLPAVPYLLFTGNRTMRLLVVGCLAVTLLTGFHRVVGFVVSPEPAGPEQAETELLAWLEENHPGTPTLLTTHAQTLAVFSRANFHWTVCESSPEMTRQLLEKLPIDYMLVYENEFDCPFHDYGELNDLVQPVRSFGPRGKQIFLLRRIGPPAERPDS